MIMHALMFIKAMSLIDEVARLKLNMRSRVGNAGSAADEVDRIPYLLSFCSYQDE